MTLDDRRKFHRINFDGMVSLHFIHHSYDYLQIKDLSLTGMFVIGKFKQRQMENCHVKIFHKEKSGNNGLRALGEIVWSNDEGVGLRFTAMSLENYILLQSTLVNKSVQPAIILREFPEECPFEISSF